MRARGIGHQSQSSRRPPADLYSHLTKRSFRVEQMEESQVSSSGASSFPAPNQPLVVLLVGESLGDALGTGDVGSCELLLLRNTSMALPRTCGSTTEPLLLSHTTWLRSVVGDFGFALSGFITRLLCGFCFSLLNVTMTSLLISELSSFLAIGWCLLVNQPPVPAEVPGRNPTSKLLDLSLSCFRFFSRAVSACVGELAVAPGLSLSTRPQISCAEEVSGDRMLFKSVFVQMIPGPAFFEEVRFNGSRSDVFLFCRVVGAGFCCGFSACFVSADGLLSAELPSSGSSLLWVLLSFRLSLALAFASVILSIMSSWRLKELPLLLAAPIDPRDWPTRESLRRGRPGRPEPICSVNAMVTEHWGKRGRLTRSECGDGFATVSSEECRRRGRSRYRDHGVSSGPGLRRRRLRKGRQKRLFDRRRTGTFSSPFRQPPNLENEIGHVLIGRPATRAITGSRP